MVVDIPFGEDIQRLNIPPLLMTIGLFIDADTGGIGESIPHFYYGIVSFAVSGRITYPREKKFSGSLRSP
jgi:hypothetical protein